MPRASVGLLCCSCLLLIGSCQQPREQEAGLSKGEQVAAERTSPPAPLKVTPWFSGVWRAAVALTPVPGPLESDVLDRPGAPKSSTRAGQGPGQGDSPNPPETASAALALTIDETGHVSGALGETPVVGQLDQDTLRAQVRDGQQAGVLIATRVTEGFSATLRLSSGDSRQVFHAQFLLQKAKN